MQRAVLQTMQNNQQKKMLSEQISNQQLNVQKRIIVMGTLTVAV
jgi:hypothetical protein